LFEDIKNLIAAPGFVERHRFAPNQFIRERTLSVSLLVLFLLNMVQGALQAELDRFFEVFRGVNLKSRVVTKAGFSLARRKLHFGAFVEVHRFVVESFYDNRPVRRWKGFRLLAIDGSTARLPNTGEIVSWFGVVDNKQPRPCAIARVSTLYDVLNRIIVDAHLAPYCMAERELAVAHLEQVGAGDLLLFDRGYPAFWLFSHLSNASIEFCMRTTTNYSRAVRSFVDSGAPEAHIEMSPGSDARRVCREKGLCMLPVRVRLVRVELGDGQVEVLVTSLIDKVKYPDEIFADLYHQRWGIEEGYKVAKWRVEIENFSGKSVHCLMQDFHAKVVTTNLTAIIVHQAQNDLPSRPQRLHKMQINFSHAVACMKDTLVRLLRAPNRLEVLSAFIEIVWLTVEPIRPGRSFPREKRLTPPRFRATYKRCG
jgi:hypothetical protein